MTPMKFASILGIVGKRFTPNAQECEDCNAINELERPVCDACGGTNLRPIASKEKVQTPAQPPPKIRRAS
jgi:ribosomal protein L40E